MEIAGQINALSAEAQIFPGVVPGRAKHEPGMTNYPSNFSFETISIPKPDSPL
jgi:hypothetical protein